MVQQCAHDSRGGRSEFEAQLSLPGPVQEAPQGSLCVLVSVYFQSLVWPQLDIIFFRKFCFIFGRAVLCLTANRNNSDELGRMEMLNSCNLPCGGSQESHRCLRPRLLSMRSLDVRQG